jgi:hypothetical protein
MVALLEVKAVIPVISPQCQTSYSTKWISSITANSDKEGGRRDAIVYFKDRRKSCKTLVRLAGFIAGIQSIYLSYTSNITRIKILGSSVIKLWLPAFWRILLPPQNIGKHWTLVTTYETTSVITQNTTVLDDSILKGVGFKQPLHGSQSSICHSSPFLWLQPSSVMHLI